MDVQNLYSGFPDKTVDELCNEMLRGDMFRLERIVSTGQVTPPGQWYDQDTDEWAVLLTGAARLRFEGDESILEMSAGDYVNIPARCRHRVEWTDPERPTVWLAIHYQPDEGQL